MDKDAAAGGYPQGVKLGVDVGTVRVGVAICDRDSILATPYKTLERNAKKNSDVRVIVKLVQELGAVPGAGIVHENIQPAQVPGKFVNDGSGGPDFRGVQLPHHRLPSPAADLLGRFLGARPVGMPGDAHIHPGFSERDGGSLANARI